MGKQIEELQAQVKQLAAESAALKSAIKSLSNTAEECELNGDELRYIVGTDEFEALTDLLDETPATDAILTSLRAEGVEMLAGDISAKAMESERGSTAFALLLAQAEYAKEFSAQLRSKSEVQS